MALSDILDKIRGKSKEPSSVNLTSITLKFGGDTHALGGREIKEQVFDLDIPFQNKMGSGLLPDNLKGPEITINEIKVEKPFELVKASPQPPLNIAYLGSTHFKLKIRIPTPNYSGPLAITFGTDSKDNVNIDVERMVLIDGTKRTELDGTKVNMILKKQQIIRRDIQAYNILKHGRTVHEVKINKPFEIVSIDPPAPFTVDKKDSYVLKMYIKCPEFNYAGPMEISFK